MFSPSRPKLLQDTLLHVGQLPTTALTKSFCYIGYFLLQQNKIQSCEWQQGHGQNSKKSIYLIFNKILRLYMMASPQILMCTLRSVFSDYFFGVCLLSFQDTTYQT
ncbi:hypothetical protein ACJX0J_007318 [Zea mays]